MGQTEPGRDRGGDGWAGGDWGSGRVTRGPGSMQLIAEREQARPGDGPPLGGVEATTVVAAALGLAVFAWHTWLTLRGYFWQDDFRYLTLAATKPLGSLLVTGYSGHLMPGQFLLVWLLTAVAPMKYTVT